MDSIFILKISKYEGLHLAAEGFSEEVKPFWPTDFKRFWYEGLSLSKPRLKDYWSGSDNIINGGNNTTQHQHNSNTNTTTPSTNFSLKFVRPLLFFWKSEGAMRGCTESRAECRRWCHCNGHGHCHCSVHIDNIKVSSLSLWRSPSRWKDWVWQAKFQSNPVVSLNSD